MWPFKRQKKAEAQGFARASARSDAEADPARASREHTSTVRAWIRDDAWREWDAPLHIAAGTSHHDAVFRSIAGPPREDGWLVPCEASLEREPTNPYDRNAIAVLIDGLKVANLKREVCEALTPVLDEEPATLRVDNVPAIIRGGWPDAPSFGVWLWLDRPDIREYLPGVDFDRLRWGYASWPWGTVEEARFSGDTAKGLQPGGEPRMPPISGPVWVYREDVNELKRRERLDDAESLLLALIEKTEGDARRYGNHIAPWCYEQLAIVRHKQGDLDGEIAILERFVGQPHDDGSLPSKLAWRLDRAKEKRSADPEHGETG